LTVSAVSICGMLLGGNTTISPYVAGVICRHFYTKPDIGQATLGSEWSLNLRPPRHGHL